MLAALLISPQLLAQASDEAPGPAGPGPAHNPSAPLAPLAIDAIIDQRALLVTHPGAGAGGADESRLQTASLGMTTLGVGAGSTGVFRIADDFTLSGSTTITSITLYAYQTGSTTTSTFNTMRLQIWNGDPSVVGSAVVFGDTTTNRFSSSAFSNIYRVTETTSGNTQRPLMAVTASGLSIPLAAGTYWLDFQTGGTIASGPFHAPITIIGQSVTGNALQFNGTTWGPANDAGPPARQQGIPMTINGTVSTTFTGGAITIPAGAPGTTTGPAAPYPATISVSGLVDSITNVTVRLNGFSHTFPDDVDVLLTSPAGQRILLMSDTGGGAAAVGVNLAFNAAAVASLTDAGPTVSGIFLPTNFVSPDGFPAPAPAAPYSGDLTTTYGPAAAQNGVWSLFVFDDAGGDVGSIASWSLEITTAAPVGGPADLVAALTDSPDPVTAGMNLTYTATATNNGPGSAAAVSISLPLPAGTSFVSATPSAGGICNAASPVVCNWAAATGTGAANARSVVVVALVAPSATGPLNATVTVASTTADPGPGLNTASATTTVNGSADLSITLTDAPDPVTAGTNLTYTATVTNGGTSDAQGVNITLPLPAGTTFVSATPSAGGLCNAASPVVCTWAGPTAPTITRTATIVVAVAPATTGVLSATATAASTTADPGPGLNTATATTVVNGSADLSITLTDTPDPVTAGTNLTYTATVTNGGPSDAQGVNISLPLPAGTTFVSATRSAGGTCSGTTTVVCTWAGATAPTVARTATIVVLVSSAQTAGLSATATGASTTTDPTSPNTATATTAVVASANLTVTLTDAPDPVTAGTNLTYTATVSNAGPSDATGVTVTLPTPANTSFVSGTVAGGGSCAGAATITCTFTGSVVAGGSRAATIVVLVAAATPNGTVISATVTATAATPDPALPNTATTTTTVSTSANLALTFGASATNVVLNQPVVFTATSTNLGPSDAQNVSITITLSPDFRFSSLVASAGAVCTAPQIGLSGVITCTWAGATAPNATRTLAVTAYSNSPGTSSIQASTSSPTADPVAANNITSVSVTVGATFEPIPSLDLRGLMLLIMLIGLVGFVAMRRQD